MIPKPTYELVLLYCYFVFSHDAIHFLVYFSLTPLQRRRLEGCLCRVPIHFYVQVWDVMSRTPQGVTVQGSYLPQNPTLSNMTQSELNFALLVEEMLNHIQKPEYRQTVVEVSTLSVCTIGIPVISGIFHDHFCVSQCCMRYVLQSVIHLQCLHFGSFE